MNPICSVIIPTRNCLPYLKAALATVCVQQIDGVEIIVIDDGSTDGTGDWVRRFDAGRSALRVIDGPGAGPARARNIGLAAANAGLVAFLDADDAWLAGKLARQLAHHAARPEVVLSFTDYLHVDVNGRSHGTCFDYWGLRLESGDRSGFCELLDAEAAILESNPVGTSTVMATTRDLQIANGFAEHLRSAEDWDLWLRLAARGAVTVIDRVLAHYLMHRPGNLTGALCDRVDSLHQIGSRYEERRGRSFRKARRALKARIAEAESDAAYAAGEVVAPLAGRLKALALRPSIRLARESALAARDVVRRTVRR
jgi:glycosyltransferase involved in cell wall biosynthesis